MKKIAFAPIIPLLLASCLSSPRSMLSGSLPLGSVAERTIEADKERPAAPIAEDTIEGAIARFDLDGLKRLVGNASDIKKLVAPGTPLLIMAERAQGRNGDSAEMIDFLASKKAYILQRDAKGDGLEDVIAQLGLEATPRHDQVKALRDGPHARYRDALRRDSVEGLQALSDCLPVDSFLLRDAAAQAAARTIDYALAEGVDASAVDPKNGDTALHILCRQNSAASFDARIPPAKSLLAAGADVDAKNDKGQTPAAVLIEASYRSGARKNDNSENLMLALLEKGADPAGASFQGNGALYHAVNLGMPAVVSVLMDKGVNFDDKALNANKWNIGMIELLIGKGVPPEKFVKKLSCLTEASDQRVLIDLLLAKGVAASSIDPQQLFSHFELVAYLIEKGGKLDGSNILVNAVSSYSGDLGQLRFLVEHGADLGRRYPGGKTIMHYAVEKGDANMAELLIGKGAPINEKDNGGRTPLDWVSKRKAELRSFLEAKGAVSGKS